MKFNWDYWKIESLKFSYHFSWIFIHFRFAITFHFYPFFQSTSLFTYPNLNEPHRSDEREFKLIPDSQREKIGEKSERWWYPSVITVRSRDFLLSSSLYALKSVSWQDRDTCESLQAEKFIFGLFYSVTCVSIYGDICWGCQEWWDELKCVRIARDHREKSECLDEKNW